ncbi:MAG: urease accessory protein UreF, partial [Mesorhizobium sp.]
MATANPIRTATLIRITIITMTDQPSGIALLRLMAWLSPAFPVGGFAYSHGLERAVHD